MRVLPSVPGNYPTLLISAPAFNPLDVVVRCRGQGNRGTPFCHPAAPTNSDARKPRFSSHTTREALLSLRPGSPPRMGEPRWMSYD